MLIALVLIMDFIKLYFQSLLAEMEAMKGSTTGKDLNILSEQLGKDAVSRVHRLELENQRLLRELEAAKVEKEVGQEHEAEAKKIHANIVKLEEQVIRTILKYHQQFITVIKM